MVITCSDTRTPETDTSGQLIQKLLKEQGHSIAAYHLVKDEPAQIKGRIAEGIANDAVQAIIIWLGLAVIFANLMTEIIRKLVDPRLRTS